MAFVYQGDTELESKSKKAAERISENMHIVANEPSLALYRLQEHVRKALPPMVERRVEVTKLQHELQGRCYDVEYALSQRASKFTEDEIMLFQKLLKKYRGTILCKKSGKVNPKEREMAWEKLTEEFNASTGVTKQRSIVQMKNKWDYMKRLAKKEAAAFKKATQEAREGSPPPPLDESTIFLIDTMRASMAGFENDSCDALDEVSEKPKSIEDNTVESEIEDMQSCGSKNGSTNLNVIDYSRLNDLEIKVKVEQECPDSPEAHQNILPHSLKLRRLQFNETTARNTRARYMEMTERKKKYWLPVKSVYGRKFYVTTTLSDVVTSKNVDEKFRRKENEKKFKLELEILKKKSDNMSIEQERLRLECQVQREELEIRQLMKKKLELDAVKSMDGAATSFMNIQEMLKQSIFLKQQLKYEEARRNKKDSNSVYKRLSAHIVLDLPDLSEFSMVRETTNRIENMMAHARGSSAELHRSHTTLH